MTPQNPFQVYDAPPGPAAPSPRSGGHEIDDFLSGSAEPVQPLQSLRVVPTLRWFAVLLTVSMFVLLGRIWYLQIGRGAYYESLAEGNRIRQETVKAARGTIMDRHGTALVKNIPNFSLQIIPADLPTESSERGALLQLIADQLGITLADVEDVLRNVDPYSYDPVTVRDFLAYDRAIELRTASSQLPGVRLETRAAREYPFGATFAHVLGYTGKVTDEDRTASPGTYLIDDDIGKSGIERTQEVGLRGTDGKKQIEVDAIGKEKKILANREPVTGSAYTLTIDLPLQQYLTERLDAWLERSHGTGAAAVALDPRNGDVRAFVSLPTFDPNAFVRGIDADAYRQLIEDRGNPLFNRVVTGQYPSGSTIKPVIAAAALAEGVITPATTVQSTGGIRINQWFFPDWKAGGHGTTDVRKAIAESVNTFFYTIGGGLDGSGGLGVDRIRAYAERFGLNATTGIEIPAERPGFIPSREWKETTKGERWYVGDTYLMSIGQGDLLVTPLQIAVMTATVANDGTRYRPHLIAAVTDAQGERTQLPQVAVDAAVDRAALRPVQEGLRQAVLSGSAKSLAPLPIAIAGKTGTAQFGDENRTHSWFTSYAPYESPELVLSIIIEGGGEGNDAALPAARDIWEWYAQQPKL
ncbi:MAG: penicillin-binding protein 2 [Candidatus Kerfeldbacteria bacterium]|nr:penicillin-binding protein 2 [Candidatus Kerfeldbacteria bacterium]